MQLFSPKLIARTIFVCAIIMSTISIAGCIQSPSNTHGVSQPQSSAKCKMADPAYDCAASSLYGLCTKFDVNISYDNCVQLLPKGSKGNNMLEFKQVLQSLGFNVKAERFSAEQSGDVNLPCIVLLIPSGINTIGGQPGPIGHYMVLWPVDAEKLEILDYPRPPVIISRNYWGKHLQTIGIDNVPMLICDRQK
jgi:ABC-type bacteriocin/lantibiotic exporter with double-glycine peptidase domain